MAIYTAISLCSGIGMLDHGINAALDGAFVPVLYVEREAFCAASLVEQMEKKFLAPAHIWDNVKTVTRPKVRRVIRERLGGKRLDFIVGGIPCQVYSNAGKRLGRNDDRDLWPATLEAIKVYQPRFVFIENVEGISSHIDGARRLVCDLEGAGYRTKAGLFSSKECGAFHERRRWFFLGIADDTRLEGWSEFKSKRGNQSPAWTGNMGLADNDIIGCNTESISVRSGRQNETNIELDRGSDELADAGDSRLSCTGEKSQSDGKIFFSGDACGKGRLADTEIKRIGRKWVDNGKSGLQINASKMACTELSFPHYAPARNDFRSWAVVAEVDPSRMPAIESALRRVVNGLADWNLQLSAVGNGVDPLVAAYAFLTLAACMQED